MVCEILQGDVFDMLATLPDDHFDCVITSPPYWGLRDYGTDGQLGLEPTLQEHLQVMVDVFAEVHRVLKPSGTLWLNYGDCYASTPNGRSAADTKAKGDDDRTFRDKPFSTVGPICADGPPSTTTRASNPRNKQTAPPSSKRVMAGGFLPTAKPRRPDLFLRASRDASDEGVLGMTELKPCPYCGGEHATETAEGSVVCNCGASIPNAVTWNARADTTKAEALLSILDDDRLLEAIARGYDAVDFGFREEKNPWGYYLKELEELDPEIALGWKQGRIECAKEGIYLALEVVEEEE